MLDDLVDQGNEVDGGDVNLESLMVKVVHDLEDALAGRNYAALRSHSILALLLAGVDGDVAGFYALEADLWPRIRTELQPAMRCASSMSDH